ncbi:MAG: hypothetical protein J6Y78_05095 [Paludibacteraceae bacterium]|nr:hypothetical protein [Paludibacteraceae bacterium]
MFTRCLKHRLQKIMQKEYKKTNESDYSDCGFPVEQLGRDLYLTFLKILDDEKMHRWSLLSKKDYRNTVFDYYETVKKNFEEEYYC